MIFLALICLIGLCAAIVFATQKAAAAKSTAAEVASLEEELSEARTRDGELLELKMEMRGREERLAAEQRIAGEREEELGRLDLSGHDAASRFDVGPVPVDQQAAAGVQERGAVQFRWAEAELEERSRGVDLLDEAGEDLGLV